MIDDENDVLEFPEDEEPTIDDIDQDPGDEDEEAELEAGADDSARIKELEDRYVRLFAEYDNFRKRTAKEKEDLYSSAVVEVTKQWLSVLDNIDRALDAARTAAAEDGEVDGTEDKMLQGLELIKKQAQDVLAKINVTEIECERGTASFVLSSAPRVSP